MKKYFNDTWYMYAIVFVFCFMLFLYEPLVMFLSNISDFWFGLGIMFKMTGLLFLIVFIFLIIGFNIIYFINREKSKKIFKICTIIMFIVLFCSYIQGNYLVGSLPVLDGTPIEWSNYKFDWVVSILLWVIAIIGIIFVIKKFTLEKTVKYTGFVSLAILVMLSLSLTTSFLSSSESKEKDYIPLITYKDINKYSTDNNFIIFLLDCTDSKAFYKKLNADDDFKDMLNDFTYYPDTMSGHLYTAESIPLILTGEFYQNEAPITEWSTEAYKKSYLFDLMEKNDYELDVYESMLYYNDASAERINNLYGSIDNLYGLISKKKFFTQELKYILFRYLPSFMKKYSSVEDLSFGVLYLVSENARADNGQSLDDRFYDESNYEFYKVMNDTKIETVDNKVFKFIHLDGAHVPWGYGKDFKKIKNATYENEIDSCLSLLKQYLNMLKDSNVYNNSTIILMADHGFGTEENGSQRRNPIFFIKGKNDTHKSMQISNKPISFVDLNDLYKDLVEGKNTKDLFKNIKDNRTRRFLHYTFATKDTMVEYETTGKAWDNDKIYKTGNVYTRK